MTHHLEIVELAHSMLFVPLWWPLAGTRQALSEHIRGSRHMVSNTFVEENRADIMHIAHAHGATRVRVFGPAARGTARPDSELDLLVEFEPGRSLLDLVAIKQDLEDLLGREVHVVTEAAVSPSMREEILQDATPL